MSDPKSALMQRRAELLARIAAQRCDAARIAARLSTPLGIADRGIAVIRFIGAKPSLTAAIMAVFVARRHGMVSLARSSLILWGRYRRLSSILARLSLRG